MIRRVDGFYQREDKNVLRNSNASFSLITGRSDSSSHGDH